MFFLISLHRLICLFYVNELIHFLYHQYVLDVLNKQFLEQFDYQM
nr:MAG TPA: hypothetical protein [Caudoviricetes sp.]